VKTRIIVKKEDVINSSLKLALKLADDSGKLLLKKSKIISKLKVKTKVAQGVASEADTESEKLIIKGIKKSFPHHLVLAEESAYEQYNGEKERFEFLKEKEWVWIIDPLDGTNNFLNGLDYYAICISLAYYGKPVMGVVYRPENGDLFHAILNKGAFFQNKIKKLKKQRIVNKKSSKKPLKDSLLVTGFTTEKGEVFDQEFELFKSMMGKSRGIRRMGSAALDLCYLALGIFDCFWESGLAPWDVAAPGLICQESKLKVTDYSNNDFHPFQENILATRSALHEEVLNIFSKSL
jgi:myo-inositol-1(or 4)-monophosphatase